MPNEKDVFLVIHEKELPATRPTAHLRGKLGDSDNRVRNWMQSKTINCVIFNNSSLFWISQKCLKFEDIENKSGKIREKIGKEKEKDYLCIIIYRPALLGFV